MWEYCLGCGVEGPPLFKQFKVYGTWQLASPDSILCTAMKHTKKKKKGIAPKWCVKSMIKHFHRHKRQPVVFSHVNKKKKKMKLPHCWNPLISPMAAWKKKPLKIKIRVKHRPFSEIFLKLSPAFTFYSQLLNLLWLTSITSTSTSAEIQIFASLSLLQRLKMGETRLLSCWSQPFY